MGASITMVKVLQPQSLAVDTHEFDLILGLIVFLCVAVIVWFALISIWKSDPRRQTTNPYK